MIPISTRHKITNPFHNILVLILPVWVDAFITEAFSNFPLPFPIQSNIYLTQAKRLVRVGREFPLNMHSQQGITLLEKMGQGKWSGPLASRRLC